MSNEGRIVGWKDNRGFGFIAPSSGGERPFVHISAFVNRDRRPKENDLVSYLLERDSKGRMQAVQVEFAGEARRPFANFQAAPSILLAVTFLSILGICVALGAFKPVLLVVVVFLSLIAFLMYWYDKAASQSGRWRTRESTLHLVGLAGGWPGALIAMKVFRHKSSKRSFQVVFWVTVVINCGAFVWLATPSGANLLRSVLDGR